MSEPIRLSVIICTWNRAATLAVALDSIERSELPTGIGWEILVVDNNSSDDTRRVVEAREARQPERYRYFFEPRQGKSFALNTAVEHARGDILVFTDDDVTVEHGWLGEILRIHDTTPCIGIGGKIVDAWSSPKPNWLSLDGPYGLMTVIVKFDHGDEICELKTPPFGANMSLRKEIFSKYGLFRTDLGPTSGSEIRGEDVEFCRRLILAGEKLLYAPKAVVFHPVIASRVTKRYFQDWYYAYGKSMARIEGVPESAVRYFGVPRYLLLACAKSCLLWATAWSEKRRLFYKLQLWSNWGRLVEAWRQTQQPIAGDRPKTSAVAR